MKFSKARIGRQGQGSGGRRPLEHRRQADGHAAADARRRDGHRSPLADQGSRQAHCLRADILVAAIGRPKMITGDMVKPGAVVIDVGINRQADGKLCGDVDFESLRRLLRTSPRSPGAAFSAR